MARNLGSQDGGGYFALVVAKPVANTVDVKDINQVLTDNEIGSFTKEHGGPLETFRLLTVDTEEHDAKVRRPLERARLLALWPRRRLPQSDPPSRPRPDRC